MDPVTLATRLVLSVETKQSVCPATCRSAQDSDKRWDNERERPTKWQVM